jgi:hypothetical protein
VSNKSFCYELCDYKKHLEAALTQLQSKEKDEGHKYMANYKLLPKELSDMTNKQYKKLFDNGHWPPAKNLHDSKAPPKHFGHLSQVDSTDKDKLIQLTRTSLKSLATPVAVLVIGAAAAQQKRTQVLVLATKTVDATEIATTIRTAIGSHRRRPPAQGQSQQKSMDG